MCPISVIDAMPNCNFSKKTSNGKHNMSIFYPNNIQFKMFGNKNSYFGKINSDPNGKLNDDNCNQSMEQNGFKTDLNVPKQVTYTIELEFTKDASKNVINEELKNISTTDGTVLEAPRVAAILNKLSETLKNNLEFSDPKFWVELIKEKNKEIIENLVKLGIRKSAGDFFQEVFVTFKNNKL